jgi:hypothetical protein
MQVSMAPVHFVFINSFGIMADHHGNILQQNQPVGLNRDKL